MFCGTCGMQNLDTASTCHWGWLPAKVPSQYHLPCQKSRGFLSDTPSFTSGARQPVHNVIHEVSHHAACA